MGVLNYKEYSPHSSLQNHVKCFWIMEREYTCEHPVESVTPDAFVELIINLGAPYLLQRDGAPEIEMPRVILVGLQSRPLTFRCEQTVRLVATRFYAWGALPFLGDHARGMNKLAAALGEEWESLAAAIEPKVRDLNYDAAIAQVEDHLVKKLLVATIDLKKIQSAAKMLYMRKGQVRSADLAEQCNLSSRQVQRQFQDVLGFSAKALARAVRFEEIRKHLMRDPNQDLAALAYDHGYTDQAHFNHEFKEFAGRTPRQFAREMLQIKALFSGPEHVVFLQSEPMRQR